MWGVFGIVLGAAARTDAGVILVSGDSNTTDTLNAAGNEQQFFLNVLAGGSVVRILDFVNGGSYGSAGNTDSEINAFYSSLVGVNSALVGGSVTAATLAGVDLFVAPLPDDNFSAAEVTAIQNFLGAGGTLFLLGENNNAVFNTPNGAINQLLNDLGSAIDLVPNALSGPGTFAVDPFTAGLGDLRFVAGSQITGGKTLYSNAQGQGLMARENTANVPEPLSLSLLGLGLAGLGIRRRRRAQ